MSETSFPSDEDDQEAAQTGDTDDDVLDLTGPEAESGQEANDEGRPGDPTYEEMLRRALNSGMDNTPPPDEPFIKTNFKR